MTVPPDAVEAAARALYLLANSASPSLTWEGAELYWRGVYREEATAALTAAAPLIAKQALLDLIQEIASKTPDGRRAQAFCAGMDRATTILTARAATLTPKEN